MCFKLNYLHSFIKIQFESLVLSEDIEIRDVIRTFIIEKVQYTMSVVTLLVRLSYDSYLEDKYS
jgi:hypothetical protein